MHKLNVRSFPFHVFLLSVYPATALLANNLGQTAEWVLRRPLIVSVLLAGTMLIAAQAVVRDWQKAGLLAGWVLLLFFTYGHVYTLVEDARIFGFLVGRHRFLVVAWGIIFLVGIWGISKLSKELRELTLILNAITLLLVSIQVGQIVAYQIQRRAAYRQAEASLTETFLNPENIGEMPDVYLIILDMYGREDAVKAHYKYDNHAFVSRLEQLGFYVASCGRSNYSHTVLSLSSQLNMDYVDRLLDDINYDSASYLLTHSKVRKAFEEIGYSTIAFDTGIPWANIEDADSFYVRPPEGEVVGILDPFEMMFIEGTLGRLYLDYYIGQVFEEFVPLWTPFEMKAQRTMMVLDRLPLIPAIEGPKFIHAHIMVPHPPHVFNPDGSINLQADEVDDLVGFPIQLDFLNPQILDIVEKIIRDSNPEPIIIIQGDHGLANFQRTSILNALYLPRGGEDSLYPQISLVNTFRVVFNQYFGTDLPLLQDVSYLHQEGDLFTYVRQEEWNPACLP